MDKSTLDRPQYGNWIGMKLIYIPALVGFGFLGLAFFARILVIPAVLFLLISVYFGYARYQFAPWGQNLQDRIRTQVLDRVDWDGKGQALDIGCGNAALTIALAKKHPGAAVVGIDHWGRGWDYSQQACERNAQVEGVAPRVTFQKASASRLPFPDGHFEAVVSNLTFHEVADTADKRALLQEALRVVKPGGTFVFQDLFLIRPMYGKMDDLLDAIRHWGIDRVEFIETRNAPYIPLVLKLPFMVGTIGILAGKK